jgi:hypothetical protein
MVGMMAANGIRIQLSAGGRSMARKRRFAWSDRSLCLACLVFSLLACWGLRLSRVVPPPADLPLAASSPKSAASLQQAWQSVRYGMTKRQVEELLGPPGSTLPAGTETPSSNHTASRWVDADGNVFVVFMLGDQDGTVFAKTRRLVGGEWETGFE